MRDVIEALRATFWFLLLVKMTGLNNMSWWFVFVPVFITIAILIWKGLTR